MIITFATVHPDLRFSDYTIWVSGTLVTLKYLAISNRLAHL
jgi:hypothetical protein